MKYKNKNKLNLMEINKNKAKWNDIKINNINN